jgi:arylsulfatase A-like enzyme
VASLRRSCGKRPAASRGQGDHLGRGRKIPAGTSTNELAATIDILPTLAKLAGAAVPGDRIIDGRDIWPLMSGEPNARSPHDAYYYYWALELQAVRSGPWKLHFPHAYRTLKSRGSEGKPGENGQGRTELALYNLETDVGESTNVADQHPEVVERLKKLADAARDDLGDSATGQKGRNVRPAGAP